MASPHDRLRELGITLPRPPAPVASYVPTLLVPLGDGRSLLYIAGQISSRDGDRLTGRCLDQVDLAKAQDAARAAAINVLAQIEGACGLDSVEQLLQVSGYVLSAEGFGDQPKVLNAASDLFGEVFGEGGRHTRVALGVNALPFSVTVEISAVVAVRSR